MAESLHTNLLKVCTALEQRYGRREYSSYDDYIECLIYQILELAATEKAANEALKRIRDEYVDWNDMRSATVREIQDILGPRYVRCREKAEDLSSLLADLYTAFRSMDLSETARTPEGIETLRALPETTLIRGDMVERGLLQACNLHTFPIDDEQFELLKFFEVLPEDTDDLEEWKHQIEETLDRDEMLHLSRGLREHADLLTQYDEYDPQPIDFEWDQPDPLNMTKGRRKAVKKEKEVIPKPILRPRPVDPNDPEGNARPLTGSFSQSFSRPKINMPPASSAAKSATASQPATEAKPAEAKPTEAKPAEQAPESEPAAATPAAEVPAAEPQPSPSADSAPEQAPTPAASIPDQSAQSSAEAVTEGSAAEKPAPPEEVASVTTDDAASEKPAKKTSTKKAAAKKTAAKKTSTKKAASKKTAAKKTSTKKAAAKKTAAKKTSTKKAATKKTAAKKTTEKKSTPAKAAAKKKAAPTQQ